MNTIKISLFTLFTFLLFGNLNAQFSSAESAEYDASENRWFVSNGNVFVVEADGSTSNFGTAQASFGLEVMNGNLYGVQGAAVKGYDLISSNTVMTANISGAGFLNGLASDGNNRLWVTDFSNNKIHQIDVTDLTNPVVTEIVSNTQTTPNGIIYDGANNRLLFTSWSGASAPITAVDLTDFTLSTAVTTNVGRVDGIDNDSDGNYFISSWSPSRITKYNSDFSAAPVIVTTPFISSPADIGYSKETDTLAIPVGNNVVFVDLAPDTVSGINSLVKEDFQLAVSPNPSNGPVQINFFLAKSKDLSLALFNTQGQLISTLLEGNQSQGYHKISLAGHSLAQGQYFIVLNSKESSQTVFLQISN